MDPAEQPPAPLDAQAPYIGTLPVYLRIGTSGEYEVATVEIPFRVEATPGATPAVAFNAVFDQAEFRRRLAGVLRGVADVVEHPDG